MINGASVHEIKPVRTCSKVYANYPSFKPYLREDFNRRCGYCDCDDYHSGGSRGYQIDHFKPKDKFIELKEEYSNLVYSCPYCNRAKWSKWKDDGFVDPCEDEYESHLYRNEKGMICYSTERGRYIFEEMNLGMERHEIIWMIRKLEVQKGLLKDKLDKLGQVHDKRFEALDVFLKIQDKIDQYTKMFRQKI